MGSKIQVSEVHMPNEASEESPSLHCFSMKVPSANDSHKAFVLNVSF